ncbi:hypothetical protein OG762_23245 [Streptomyces sp. NBC_01136]|uniref:hypothetical protein n=1 Tax=unclassified Streptomyces TaxID=2593676 RepID=UPI003245B4D2|nr:hypothetical protein OG762_23245 [Streptomyces sp. NBC_01136]
MSDLVFFRADAEALPPRQADADVSRVEVDVFPVEPEHLPLPQAEHQAEHQADTRQARPRRPTIHRFAAT